MLEKKYNSKIKQEYLDIDYIDKLNDDEKDFLNRFLEETLNARFNHKGKKLIKSKEKKKEIYSENNARNRCMYNLAKVSGKLSNGMGGPDAKAEAVSKNVISENPEDYIIEALDKTAKK